MSVIVSKRSISNMQFYKTARDLRRDITKMLEQMFSDESKFCYSRGLEYYLQTRILELMGQVMEAITRANEIYPTTQIIKLSRGFTFLKCKYHIDSSTGRIIMKPDKSGMIRMCRKMRKFEKNQLPQDQIENAYKTWKGYWKKLGGDTRKTDSLYKELFGGVA